MDFLKKNPIIILLAILALASFFRLWQIDLIPPGLYPDEAINGNDAVRTLELNDYQVFYPENNGREGLFIWLIAFVFKILGPSAWALRLVSALFGILTVLGLYLMTKELFRHFFTQGSSSRTRPRQRRERDSQGQPLDKKKSFRSNFLSPEYIALLASFFLAVSFWHTNFSRIGFRAIMVPFFICFTLYFLLRAFRKNNILDYLWAGIFFGIGFYSYIAYRFFVLLIGFLILFKLFGYWPKGKLTKINWDWPLKKNYLDRGWWKIDLFLVVAIIIALPLGLYFLDNPGDFIGRASGVSVFSSSHPIKELFLSSLKTLAMFNFVGDWNWRHNLAGSPMFAWSVGIFFILGLFLSLKEIFLWIKYSFNRAEYYRQLKKPRKKVSRILKKQLYDSDFSSVKNYLPNPLSVFLLIWFLIMLLPSILTAEGLPHALRTIGVIPVAYIFAAWGLIWLIDKFSRAKISKSSASHKISPLIIPLLLIFSLIQPALANFNKYFVDWAKSHHLAGAFRKDLTDLTDYLNNLPDNVQKYIIVNESGVPVPYPDGLPMPAQTIIFQSRANQSTSEIRYLLADINGQAKITGPSWSLPP